MMPGVVDQNIDDTHFLVDAGNHGVYLLFAGHVTHISRGPQCRSAYTLPVRSPPMPALYH